LYQEPEQTTHASDPTGLVSEIVHDPVDQDTGLTASSVSVNGPVPPETQGDPSGPDPFDPAYLTLSQDFATATGARKLVTTIPVRKPSKESFVRTHPDEAYRLRTYVLELKEAGELYLVAPTLWEALKAEPTVSPRLLVTTVNRDGTLFVWPIRLPGPDGRIDDWNRSALEAADMARSRWIRVAANMDLRANEITESSAITADPAWPDLSFREILRIAFRDKMISSWDHPVLRRLRGEI
jgi:hypothetical protein